MRTRPGLIAAAFFATALVGSTALAERTNDSDNQSTHHAREIKDRVLRGDKSGYGHEQKTQVQHTEKVSKRVETKVLHRDRGEVIDNYGHKSGTSTTTTSTNKLTKAPAKLAPKSEEMVDSKGKTASHSNMGTQVGWSAGGKSIRSYVHFVNDKGELNNNIHGSTATAMKMRHVANVLLRTAGMFGKLFSWQGSGGDNSESLF